MLEDASAQPVPAIVSLRALARFEGLQYMNRTK